MQQNEWESQFTHLKELLVLLPFQTAFPPELLSLQTYVAQVFLQKSLIIAAEVVAHIPNFSGIIILLGASWISPNETIDDLSN